jgi:DNA damage-binding protein 1
VREHNLLYLAFHPGPSVNSGPVVTFLSQSPQNDLILQTRILSLKAHAFTDLTKPLNVVLPGDSITFSGDDLEYNEIPFSCPAATMIVPIPTTGTDKMVLVVGDEYCVLYSIALNPTSPKVSRLLISPTTGMSPRAASRRSPQAEMTGVSKRRKSSTSGQSDQWKVEPVWRIRQGFGTVLA